MPAHSCSVTVGTENQKDTGLEHKTERIMVVSEKRKTHVGERKTERHTMVTEQQKES